MRKRLLATLLAVLMVFSLLPATALADTGASSSAAVAEVNGKGQYATLADAFAAATDGDTVKLLANVSSSTNVIAAIAGNNITFDLNGFTVSFTGNAGITVKGNGTTLTVTDLSGGQTGAVSVSRQYIFHTTKNSQVIIDGGIYTGKTLKSATSGPVTINGGTFNMDVAGDGVTVNAAYVVYNGSTYNYSDDFASAAAFYESLDQDAPNTAYIADPQSGETGDFYFVEFQHGFEAVCVSYRLRGIVDVKTPGAPEREGWTFLGWSKDNGATVVNAGANIRVSSKTTYVAQWKEVAPETVIVTVNLAGGNIDDNKGPITNNEFVARTAYTPAEPVRDGYRFTGWVDSEGNAWTSGSIVNANLTITAKWEQIEYKVQFDPNGGTWDDGTRAAKVEYTTDGSIASVKLENPTKEGYEFTGWWYGDTRWGFNTKVVEDINLTAGWNPIEYTVTVDANGGDLPAGQGDSLKVKYGETVTVQSPTMTGATFMGWADGNGNTWVSGETPITGDVAIKAVWNTNEYTVIYMDGDTEIHREQVAYGSTITYAQPDAKEGFTFEGWYQDNGFVTPWDMSQGVGGNVTLYAKYTAVTYTVEFNANSGSFINDPTISLNVNANSTIDKTYELGSDDVSRKYYTLIGWATTADATKPDFVFGTGGTPVTEATTLYAVWERDEIEITLKANTGVFENNSDTYKFTIYAGETIDWPQVEQPTKEGHHFLGWYWSNLTTPVNNDQVFEVSSTLYAGWDINVYTVTYRAEGGTFTDGTTERTDQIEHGKTFEVTDPVWGGHTFTGWLDENLQSWNTNTPITSDKTLTAAWDTNWYKVTFNFGNNSEPVVKTVKSGEQVAAPADPVREGYTFDYWYYDNPDEAFDFNTTIEGPVTLTAHWTQNVYRVTIQSGATDARLVVNGAYVEGTTFTVDVRYGQSVSDRISLNSPQRAGYNFSGWYVNGVSWDPSDAVTSDITVTANWNVGQYKVGFELNGGEGETPADQFIDHNGYVQNPGDPTREGYTFNGWHVGSETGPLWSFSDRVSSDMTLVAGWGRASNYVQFVIKEPGVTFDNGESSYGEYVQYGDKVSAVIETPERDGYTFAGWFTEDGAQWNESTPVTSDVTYYATWTPVMHTVSFNYRWRQHDRLHNRPARQHHHQAHRPDQGGIHLRRLVLR